FRIQLGPAAVLAWTWMIRPPFGGLNWRSRWIAAILGGAVPVSIAGAVDWATWGRPLQSLWLNAIANWAYGAADTFGTTPWIAYIAKFMIMWGGAAPIVIVLALV